MYSICIIWQDLQNMYSKLLKAIDLLISSTVYQAHNHESSLGAVSTRLSPQRLTKKPQICQKVHYYVDKRHNLGERSTKSNPFEVCGYWLYLYIQYIYVSTYGKQAAFILVSFVCKSRKPIIIKYILVSYKLTSKVPRLTHRIRK